MEDTIETFQKYGLIDNFLCAPERKYVSDDDFKNAVDSLNASDFTDGTEGGNLFILLALIIAHPC